MVTENYLLQFSHTRFEEPTGIKELAFPIIAITKVNILDKEKHVLVSGTSYCSVNDNFSRDTGRKRALKRAILKLFPIRAESLAERQSIWTGYCESKPEKRW